MKIYLSKKKPIFCRCECFKHTHFPMHASFILFYCKFMGVWLVSWNMEAKQAFQPVLVAFLWCHTIQLCVRTADSSKLQPFFSKVGQQSRYNWRMKTGWCGDLIQHQRRQRGQHQTQQPHTVIMNHISLLFWNHSKWSCHFDTILMRLKMPCWCCYYWCVSLLSF